VGPEGSALAVPAVGRRCPGPPGGPRYPGPVSARRTPPVPALRLLALLLPLHLAVTGCGSDASTAPSAATSSPERTTPTDRGPSFEPVDGTLRVRVPEAATADGDPTGAAPDEVLVVGDSVAVLVADELAAALEAALYVDAADCRELGDRLPGGCGGVPDGTAVESGIEAIRSSLATLAADGVVPDVAVLVLADNSSITTAELDEAMEAAGGITRVWWVNARIEGFGRQDTNNALLDDLAAREPRAGVVDWYGASADEDWLADHVHPNEVGQAAYARLVARHVECGCVP
jgi:hypothetical protein